MMIIITFLLFSFLISGYCYDQDGFPIENSFCYAVGEVVIRIVSDEAEYVGRGADTDIIVASAKAYMNALNRLLSIGV